MGVSQNDWKMEGWLDVIRSKHLGLNYSRKQYFILQDNYLNCFKSAPLSKKEDPIRSVAIEMYMHVSDNGRETINRKDKDADLSVKIEEGFGPSGLGIISVSDVLQRLMAGVLAAVLRPREAECPLVRSLGREFLTCLVMQPIMNFASPGYINELIEFIFLAANDDTSREVSLGKSNDVSGQCHDHSVASGINKSVEPHANKILVPSSQLSNISVAKVSDHGGTFSATSEHGHMHTHQTDSLHHL